MNVIKLNEKFKSSFNDCSRSLIEFIGSGEYLNSKKGNDFLVWTGEKAEKIATEDKVEIPRSYMPNKINEYEYTRLKPKSKKIIDAYYKKLDEHGKIIYKKVHTQIAEMKEDEVQWLVLDFILRRGNVVWINFGYNIGNEFGGVHPAIILKRSGDNLIVVPLSSGETTNTSNYIVKVPLVYKFNKKIPRWTSVHRMKTIHPKRIIFSDYGSVSKDVMKNISKAIKMEF